MYSIAPNELDIQSDERVEAHWFLYNEAERIKEKKREKDKKKSSKGKSFRGA